jgi:membrane protein implicated in regulation of membrane protease activity
VHHWHTANRQADSGRSNLLDRGQPVVLEGWTNEPAGIARVRYRGTSWDARVADAAVRPETGSTLYIEGQEGSTLVVAAAPPGR